MRINSYKVFIAALLLLVLLLTESCAGCSNRRRRDRQRHRDRMERYENRRSHESHEDNDNNNSRKTLLSKHTEEEIKSVSQDDDYDEMLDCLFARNGEIKGLKDEYFKGYLSDNDAAEKYEEIDKKYQPIADALDKANNEGKLNYNQHKRQMKLVKEYLEIITQVLDQVGQDIDNL